MPEPIVEPIVEPVIVKFSAENPPRSKEDWQKLAQDDPKTWMDLTQVNMDRTFREKRELENKLTQEQQEKQNLAAELNRLKTPPANNGQPVQYSTNNFPQTKEAWDNLALEDPTLAMDLRIAYSNRQNTITTDLNRARADYAKEVQAEHPELYLTELDATGNPSKDDKGNFIFKRNATGDIIFNPNSEKGKLWVQIYNESARPDGTNPLDGAPNAPRLMRAELERRLVAQGNAVIAGANNGKQNQVAAPGVPPPVSFKVSFKSSEEEAHAERAIQRGVYKNKEEYCQLRDGGTFGYYQEGRRPDFSKKQ